MESETKKLFWSVMEAVRASADTEDGRIAVLPSRLEQMEPSEILLFERGRIQVMGEAHTPELWGAAYLLLEGCSDDGFDAFKSWLMLLGQRTFERVVDEPEFLAELDDIDYPSAEEVQYAARAAYRSRAGEEMERLDAPTQVKLDLWDMDSRQEMQVRYPKLWERYGEARK